MKLTVVDAVNGFHEVLVDSKEYGKHLHSVVLCSHASTGAEESNLRQHKIDIVKLAP